MLRARLPSLYSLVPTPRRSAFAVAALGWLLAGAAAQETAPKDPFAEVLRGRDPKDRDELLRFEAHVRSLLARALPATVAVGTASGVVVDGGLVLTAGHVTRSAGRTMPILFEDDRRVDAVTLGADLRIDTGLLRITTPGEYAALPMGRSADLAVGEWVLMLGHPSGRKFGRAAPARLGRVLFVPANGFVITDCTMQAGDSGGPLVDMQGRIVGINTSITMNLAQNQHVPIDAFHRGWEKLLAGEVVERPAGRGGSMHGMRFERGGGGRGAGGGLRIADVAASSPASAAGIARGDAITHVGETEVASMRELVAALGAEGVDGSASLTLRRGEESVVVELTLPRVSADAAGENLPPMQRPRGNAIRPAKSTPAIAGLLTAAVAEANAATARVFVGGREVALGAVVDGDGWIVTKASDVGQGDVEVAIGAQRFAATRAGVDVVDDVALWKVDAKGLPVVRWSEAAPAAGSLLVSTTGTDAAPPFGVLSSPEYVFFPRRVLLGVVLPTDGSALRVSRVHPGTAAARAGVEVGDVILEVDGVPVADHSAFQRISETFVPGVDVRLKLRRDDVEQELELATTHNREAPRSTQANLWGPLSTVRAGFGRVLQHDAVLRPSQCGGPLVALDGSVVGLNIARAGRVETLALPATVVQAAVARLRAAYAASTSR